MSDCDGRLLVVTIDNTVSVAFALDIFRSCIRSLLFFPNSFYKQFVNFSDCSHYLYCPVLTFEMFPISNVVAPVESLAMWLVVSHTVTVSESVTSAF